MLLRIKFIYFIVPFLILLMARNSYAYVPDTIYTSSIAWNDVVAREKILATVPKWQTETMTSLFDIYLHPERYQLPKLQNDMQYNVQYINAFWGPLNNPFNSYARPAKVFIMFASSQTKNATPTFYMAPLIQNIDDKNYYVFDKNQAQPILLNDWVNDIRAQSGQQNLLFNICNAYGNLPSDSCQKKDYQSETKDQLSTSERLTAQTFIPSAHRAKTEDWKNKISLAKVVSNSIYDKSVSWDDLTIRNNLLNTVTTWPNYKTIVESFKKIRDLRYFLDENRADFMRRLTWLYPDDGCWTRASAIIRDFFGPMNNTMSVLPRPSKVFAFGNLCVNTNNAEDGYVTWWYHTAPVVKDAETNQTYVLDPSVNPSQPLPIEQWMKDISSQVGACSQSSGHIRTFNICNGYGANPYNICQEKVYAETASMLDQSYYRKRERNRQVVLKRDADKVLGDNPPWIDTLKS